MIRQIISMRWRIILVALMLISGCGGSGSESNEKKNNNPDRAELYLDEFLDIIRNNALTRYQVDWGSLNSEVKALAVNATSIPDLYPAITRALQLIETNHSFLLSPNGELITYPSSLNCLQDIVLERPRDERVGYIRIDAFSSRDTNEAIAKAREIQDEIAAQDNQDRIAWIVDLRNNQGGNMWPMITGLAPLFDERVLGHFVNPDEEATPWGVDSDGSFIGSNRVIQLESNYALINPLPKIAVLLSQRTASSGESVTIAFKKQYNVAFFGSDSCGLSTANTNFDLSDGSTLFLTTSTVADRDIEKYGKRVKVDFSTASGQTVSEAEQWLLE